jgi:hypothetical protein
MQLTALALNQLKGLLERSKIPFNRFRASAIKRFGKSLLNLALFIIELSL